MLLCIASCYLTSQGAKNNLIFCAAIGFCTFAKHEIMDLRNSLLPHVMIKRPSSGSGEGRVLCAEPDLNVNQNNRVSTDLVVLLRPTNQPCLMRGQECAHRSPACIHNITCNAWVEFYEGGGGIYNWALGHWISEMNLWCDPSPLRSANALYALNHFICDCAINLLCSNFWVHK